MSQSENQSPSEVHQEVTNGPHQLITRRDRHQVDALQLSCVGKKRLRAGIQDLITHCHQLTTLWNRNRRVTVVTFEIIMQTFLIISVPLGVEAGPDLSTLLRNDPPE